MSIGGQSPGQLATSPTKSMEINHPSPAKENQAEPQLGPRQFQLTNWAQTNGRTVRKVQFSSEELFEQFTSSELFPNCRGPTPI